jgi:hypothetical protein
MDALEQSIRDATEEANSAAAAAEQAFERRRNLWVEARQQDPPVPYATIAKWSGVTDNAVVKVIKRTAAAR